jgi:predicted amidohydrolase
VSAPNEIRGKVAKNKETTFATSKAAIVLGAILVVVVAFAVSGPMFNTPPEADLIPPKLAEWIGAARSVDPTKMSHRMRVAVVSARGFEEKQRNLQQIKDIASGIVEDHPDVRLIVFGESSLGLYYYSADAPAYQQHAAERIPGEATKEIGGVATRLRVYIAIGMIEQADDGLYNSVIVLDPRGKIIAQHRKMMLHYYDQLNGITKAPPNAEVADIDGFRVGLSICADGNSKWLTEAYRERGIDALIYSVTSKIPFTVSWLKYYPPAKRFNAWVLAANREGQEGKDEYPGTVFIADGGGAVHAIKSEGIGYVTAIIGTN